MATETSVAPSAGITAATRGGITSGDAVVNVEAKVCARALPATSVTPVPTVRLNAVLRGSGRLTGVSVTMRSPSEKVNVTGTVPAVVVNRSVDSLTVARATASENLTITVVFGSTSVAPGDGFTSATVGGTTSRTVTVTDAATPWFPAASRARASSVRDPPVAGSDAKAMLNVSVRDGAAGLIVRVSVKLAAPVALRLISVRPALSVAETVTLSGVRGSTTVPGVGLVVCTAGAIESTTCTVLIAGELTFPAGSLAVTLNVMVPGVVSTGTASMKLVPAGVMAGEIARVSPPLTAPEAVKAMRLTATSSAACTMRVTVWPSPTWAPSAGDSTVTVGGVRSPATTRFSVASGLTFPDASRA